MRRPRMPKLSSLVAIGWLAAMAATAALWIASYVGGGQKRSYFPSDRRSIDISSGEGRLRMSVLDSMVNEFPREATRQLRENFARVATESWPHGRGGWGVETGRLGWYFRLGDFVRILSMDMEWSQAWAGRNRISVVAVGYSAVMVVLTLLASPALLIVLVRRLRSMRRKRANLCIGCGYDLRASPERCPECGTAVGAAGRNEPRINTDEHG